MHDNNKVKIVTIASRKGGVGKTTTVAQIGAGLSISGVGVGRVVLVDTDSHALLGDYLGVGAADDFAAAFLGERAIEDCLVPVPGYDRLWVMRGGERTFDDVEIEFVQQEEKASIATTLADRLDNMFVLLSDLVGEDELLIGVIDTGPNRSMIQTAALMVADYIVCPLTPEYGGEKGMYSTWHWFQAMGRAADQDGKGFGVLPQKYDLKGDVRAFQLAIGRPVLPIIPFSDAIQDLTNKGRTIWTSKKLEGTPVHQQYARLVRKIADGLGLQLKEEFRSKQKSGKKREKTNG